MGMDPKQERALSEGTASDRGGPADAGVPSRYPT